MQTKQQTKGLRILVSVLTILLPGIVTYLYFGPKMGTGVFSKGLLPAINAGINGATTLLLVFALITIKQGKRLVHQRIMTGALVLSVVFLALYVLHHATSEPTSYGGEGFAKGFYYFILISHIIMAAVIVPLVLMAYIRAFLGNYAGHKKIVKYAYPFWMYVSVTGVIVYFMIAPYYG